MAFHAVGKTKFIFEKTNNKAHDIWDGSLTEDKNALFDLPNCLKYTEVINSGDLMSDGLLYGGDPDGMEFFDLPGKKLALVINHETSHLDTSLNKTTAYRSVNRIPYSGGTSTVIINQENLSVEKSFRSLTGTIKNWMCSFFDDVNDSLKPETDGAEELKVLNVITEASY